ncbi:MAG: FtsH protease activity modulator HflK [Verrucomicrobia bacterium]|nr:FtsH protease activity modulator HflK [Verrucomicrobiota bacterium]MBU4291999.1 FtsH protease activity modulator HflK [Verrucomicrobiota bacterium]MBU4427887.1 FtsH protease activity modulator HflK [Verrucomicrobiota bacterium]MCG2678833.1 FtsH protease activity modulator HflK [Kiritimatiellia bacterium]
MADSFDINEPDIFGDLVRQFRKSGFGQGRHPKGLAVVFPIIGALILLVAAGTSFYTVEPEEEAVIIRFGRYVSTEPPGLHFKLPFGMDKVIKVPTKRVLQQEFGFRVQEQGFSGKSTYNQESLTLTGDLNVADVEWIVQYKIVQPQKYIFNVRDGIKNIRDVSQSIMRRVVGDRLVSDVLTVGRIEIAVEAEKLTQEVLDRYDMGVRIVAIKLQDINPPESVKPAFNEVNEAKQEQEKVINQAEEEYNKVIPEARGKAEQTIRDAQGYATAKVNMAQGDAKRFTARLIAYKNSPQVTRTRLYLEAMEELYGRFKELTIVDDKVKGVLPIFAPALNAASSRGEERP